MTIDETIDRTVAVFASAVAKIIERNPTWQELPAVLTDDERRVALAFMAFTNGRRC